MAEAGNTSISIQQLKNVADSLKNQQTTFNQIYKI